MHEKSGSDTSPMAFQTKCRASMSLIAPATESTFKDDVMTINFDNETGR